MITVKYQAVLYDRIKHTITEWSRSGHIPESEMYAFLHALKGTAGTVGLPELGELAAGKLDGLDEHGARLWPKAEWQAYMGPFQEIVDALELSARGAARPAESPAETPAERPQADLILIIDDDHEFVAFLKDFLEKEGYAVSIALTAQKGLELYYQLKPDWVAIDIYLPDRNGFELLTQIVTKAKTENTPIAIISGDDSKQNRLLTYSMGALDFIAKPIDLDIFKAYLQNRLSYKKEIESAIIVDELTGAFNRRHFNAMLPLALSAYRREKAPFCLVMMDLDHFKQVNDTYGHPKGDEVLRAFVKTARQVKRETDMLFRYGGEEFAFILPNTSGDWAERLIERVRKALAAHCFESESGGFHVTFSAGVAQVSPECLHPEEMIGRADQALYHAKQNGRNRTVMYQGHLSAALRQARLHIIIVDDVFIVREILSRQFSGWTPAGVASVVVSEYADGASFLQSDWYHREDLHVILLDGMMPRMDGIDILKQIRAAHSDSNVIVTMLTARGGEFDVVNAIEHGADDYIIKPFQAEEVAARIQRLIGRRLG